MLISQCNSRYRSSGADGEAGHVHTRVMRQLMLQHLPNLKDPTVGEARADGKGGKQYLLIKGVDCL